MTRVYITIDTECREERRLGDNIQPMAGYDLRVWGRFANQRHALGIGLIMNALNAHRLRATFYVDPMGSVIFGQEGLHAVCHEIQGRGHDIQLHLHPIQRQADWITRRLSPPSDHLTDYDLDGQTALLKEGIELLVEAGVARDDLVSFRAGHFSANEDTWRAMDRAGLRISSNYNPCYADKGMALRPSPRFHEGEEPSGLFDTGLGVWELPISNFVEPSGARRHLQVTAISLTEMKDILWQADALGVGEVTIVTHSFELYHLDDPELRRGRPNRLNIHRFRGLCDFLARHRDHFQVESVLALGQRLKDDPLHQEGRVIPPPLLQGKRRHRYERLLQQIYKRAEARIPF
ncbi:MAG: hypothetical protein KAI47_22105 [Deltaproteobacteria bacterium]|nr:hypothetical protein [Deltaproteobacteria bacterium]